MNEVLCVAQMKKYFNTPQGRVKAVDDVSFSIHEGETFALVGESGSGKSTVAYVVAGIYVPTSGEIRFNGRPIHMHHRPLSPRQKIRLVFQDPGSSLNPKRTIRQILELPLKIHRKCPTPRAQIQRIAELLQMVDLPVEYMHRRPQSLSGGQKQRVAIARALATEPALVILDEPTSALDVSVQAKIMKLLRKLQADLGIAYLFITHDLALVRNMAVRAAVMYLGRLCEVAPVSDLFDHPLHPYTQMLLSSIPVVSSEEERFKPRQVMPQGETPSPIHVPSGCRFHPRCPQRFSVCSRVDPSLVEITPDHFVACHLYREADIQPVGQVEGDRDAASIR